MPPVRAAVEGQSCPLTVGWVSATKTMSAGCPTAISIVNDYVALAFLCELKKVGVRLPEELSVVGHDNQSIAAYCPVPLTTMTQPVDRITEAVLEQLKRRLGGDTSPPQQVVLRGELVVRQSAAPPR